MYKCLVWLMLIYVTSCSYKYVCIDHLNILDKHLDTKLGIWLAIISLSYVAILSGEN